MPVNTTDPTPPVIIASGPTVGAVLNVREVWYGREMAQAQDWTRTYKRIWQVQTARATVGPRQVLLSVPVALGNTYAAGDADFPEFDLASYCVGLEPRQTDDPDGREWLVTASYGPYDASQKPENPLDHPIEVSYGFSQFTKIVDEDINGDAVVNTAFDFFDPGVEVDDSRSTITIVRNEKNFDPDYAALYRDSINKFAWDVYGPYEVKCTSITAQHLLDPGIGYYFQVTYEFAINRDTWLRELVSVGMRQLSTDKTKYEHIIIKGGPITEPAMLDDNGRALAPDADPVILEYHVYKETDFAAFNFPALPK